MREGEGVVLCCKDLVQGLYVLLFFIHGRVERGFFVEAAEGSNEVEGTQMETLPSTHNIEIIIPGLSGRASGRALWLPLGAGASLAK